MVVKTLKKTLGLRELKRGLQVPPADRILVHKTNVVVFDPDLYMEETENVDLVLINDKQFVPVYFLSSAQDAIPFPSIFLSRNIHASVH